MAVPTDPRRAGKHIERVLRNRPLEEVREQLGPKQHAAPARIRSGRRPTTASVAKTWSHAALQRLAGAVRAALADAPLAAEPGCYAANIENFIGTARIPIGLAGPLRVNGLFAQGDYYVPLATTEAALVASYHRGARLVTEVGGCTAMLLNAGVSRAPGFAFDTAVAAGEFVAWVLAHEAGIRSAAETTSRYARLSDLRITLQGNHVYLNLEYTTGDAAGQNMVTLATDAACRFILARSPLRPRHWFIEANLSGDKKASALSFHSVRGREVTVEIAVPAALVRKRLHTTPTRMAEYWRMSAVGGVLAGNIGIQGHYANGLAALFIACGQDAACVAESAVGVTRMEPTETGDLYASVTLPNLMVGTVGGGTGLPTPAACLEILGLRGAGHADAFAEVCAALVLAGELSIVGALAAGDFARAHDRLARGRRSGS